MTFDDIANRVIDNKELKTVLTNYVLYGTLNPTHDTALVPYENLITFQVYEGKHPIEEYGYQVGEPWAGNIAKADILFVSKTLAYDPQEICPRYIPNEAPDAYYITETDRVRTVIENGYPQNSLLGINDVIALCNTRFERAFLNNNRTLYIQTSEGIKAVSYWGAVRNNTSSLLLPREKKALKQQYRGKPIEYARRIMKHIACTNVVPFKVVPLREKRYSEDFELGGTFKHCWGNFTQDIISLFLSTPKIIILVGNDVLNVFQTSSKFSQLQHKYKELSRPDKNGNVNTIYLYEYKGSLIVNIGANQGSMRSFTHYFTQGSQIFRELKAKFSALFNSHKNSTKEV